MTNSSSRKN